jgi:hypothetical protein
MPWRRPDGERKNLRFTAQYPSATLWATSHDRHSTHDQDHASEADDRRPTTVPWTTPPPTLAAMWTPHSPQWAEQAAISAAEASRWQSKTPQEAGTDSRGNRGEGDRETLTKQSITSHTGDATPLYGILYLVIGSPVAGLIAGEVGAAGVGAGVTERGAVVGVGARGVVVAMPGAVVDVVLLDVEGGAVVAVVVGDEVVDVVAPVVVVVATVQASGNVVERVTDSTPSV